MSFCKPIVVHKCVDCLWVCSYFSVIWIFYALRNMLPICRRTFLSIIFWCRNVKVCVTSFHEICSPATTAATFDTKSFRQFRNVFHFLNFLTSEYSLPLISIYPMQSLLYFVLWECYQLPIYVYFFHLDEVIPVRFLFFFFVSGWKLNFKWR